MAILPYSITYCPSTVMTHLPSNFCECKPRLTILKPVKQLNLNNFYLIQLKLVTKQLGRRAALIFLNFTS
jgi:hypothetical protein